MCILHCFVLLSNRFSPWPISRGLRRLPCLVSLQSHQRGKTLENLDMFANQTAPIFFTQTFKQPQFLRQFAWNCCPIVGSVLLFSLDCCQSTKSIIEGSGDNFRNCEFPVGQNCWHPAPIKSRDCENSLWANAVSLWRHSGCASVTSHRRHIAPSVDTTVQSASTLLPHHELHRNQRRNGGGEGGFKRPWYRKFVKVTASMSGEILLDSRDGGWWHDFFV